MTKRIVHVAVGMVLDGDNVLIAKRGNHQHQGGLWEFPGGKVEPGETTPQALKRELAEEVGLNVDPVRMIELTCLEFDYGDKAVRLDTWICRQFSGQASGLEGQSVRWVPVAELAQYDFPQANQQMIEQLQAYLAK
ncbi:7,8-dihydro-8-oxoguanine-triphosphatase [Saccharospirillum sp. MSK14-1]|uniref:8-oxo-dGTP diphosphatase MutT n=1 Tax=Saccharospirillum sp. MSK14-1 TaxID=1897632 RepID=UPI000D36CD1D|nr:8-oxo-dGTP diphosphatase MutT [Saccharospirillum sp. MSK14-1]PTY38966.1 7,8-dihydro-8-oxoguanine-triphosphatase [Saccharospirillum sp. MSK14-1]